MTDHHPAPSHLIQRLIYQWQVFLVALAFFTRIPVPKNTPFSKERLNKANRYFALVGLVVGGVSALVFYGTSHYFTQDIAAGLAIAASVLLTGAFHEDGFSDVCDGFGGGWDVAKKLEIMKDSRLGTYGASGLFLMLGLKWMALSHIAYPVTALIVMHVVSRATAASMIFSYPYVRPDQTSKVKPLANEQSRADLAILIMTAVVVILALLPAYTAPLVIAALICRQLCGIWFTRQIGGYTGDCLGAAQQVTELVGYLVLIAISNS
ncbi:adenosylcobinamide-GDP ribazoletransferase [Parasalinivibrio latis]|uniref:adenosylcobinamide-GDP ribazoletransferase n=1 Tax=Parasalinivibrio latis TaxID=2952610 RepID=UPI0030E59A3B